MRSVWTGVISVGLVNIPVKMFTAVQESSLDLDMLDERDLSNIQFKRVNANTGKEVPYKSIVKGFNYHNKYVVLEQEDFESADAKKTKTIELINFVDQAEIDPIYYEQPYYLEPDKTGAKAYGVIRDALQHSGRVGVATFVMRNKETLAVLKPMDRVLVLNRIRFDEEIRDFGDLNLPAISKGKSREKEMAQRLIDELTEHFDISKYKDTYTAKLMKIIQYKAKTGKRPKVPKLKVAYKQDQDDLVNMLKASLGGKRKAS